jgi:hypothetical protein
MPVALVAALAAAATLDVAAGDGLAGAVARLRPGDTLRLGPGVHRGALAMAALSGVTVSGAGAGVTVIEAAEGEPAAVVRGAVALEALTLLAGPAQCALVVDGGAAKVRDAALAGGGCGARLGAGSLRGERVDVRGGARGLVVTGGELALEGGSLHGAVAGLAAAGGTAALSGTVVFGPSREAAVTVTGGDVRLWAVTVAAPGPAGLVLSAGRLSGEGVTVAGPAREGTASACVEALGGELALGASELFRCGGTGVTASRARVRLDGVDVEGGASGCVTLVDGARADLQGVRCTARGPGLYAGSGATAQLRMNRWLVDPALVVECGAGSRVDLLYGESVRQPCTAAPSSTAPRR